MDTKRAMDMTEKALKRAHAVEADYEPLRARLGRPYRRDGRIYIRVTFWHPAAIEGRPRAVLKPSNWSGGNPLDILQKVKAALAEVYEDRMEQLKKERARRDEA